VFDVIDTFLNTRRLTWFNCDRYVERINKQVGR